MFLFVFYFAGHVYCNSQVKFFTSQSYQKSCEEAAIEFCRGGAIKDHIDAIAGCTADSSQELNLMKRNCKPAVQCLLGVETDDDLCNCILDGDC